MTVDSGDFSSLVKRLREGSQKAAWELVEQYGPHILRVVRRTLSRSIRAKFDSQDFVQAVWASFFANPGKLLNLEKPEQLVALLAAMARHKIIDEHRRRLEYQKHNVTRERSLDAVGSVVASEVTSREQTPSQIAIARERWNSLLQSQPAHYRRIVQLRLTGETYKAIAKELQISQRTVQRVLERLFREQIA